MRPVVYKYALAPAAPTTIDHLMPHGAVVLSVGIDPHGALCLWALVDIQSPHPKMPRRFLTVGTGQATPLLEDVAHKQFVGTVLQGSFVWHIFEVRI